MVVSTKQVCIILVYISSLATVAYSVISTPSGMLLGDVEWFDILRSFLSLPILLLLPGLVIQEMIFRRSNPLSELGSSTIMLLSFFLSTFVNITSAIVGYSVGYYVRGVFDFQYAVVTVYIVNASVLVAYSLYVLLQSADSLHGKSCFHIDRYALALLLLMLGILTSEFIIVSGNYPLIWGDQWRWLGNSRQVLINQVDSSTFTTMYFYIFYLALCFAFTGLPLVHTYVLIGLVTSVLVIASIYALGRSIFGTSEHATIYVWTCFLSVPFILPWIVGSTTRGTFSALQVVWNLESDVITIPDIFAPQFQFGLPAAFLLIAILLWRKPKSLWLYLTCAVIAYVGYAAHIAEIFLFEIFLTLYLLMFSNDRTGDSLFLLSSSGGVAFFLLIDLLSPFRWYSMYELGIFSLTGIVAPIVMFIVLKVMPKGFNYLKAIQTFLSSTKFVKFAIIFASSTVAVALLILFWLHSVSPHVTIYQFMKSDVSIPWFIWATRILVTLPIAILVYLLSARLTFHRLNMVVIGSSFGSFILFFITTIATLRAYRWLLGINWYFEWRLEVFLMVAMAIPVAVLLIIIRQHAKELHSRLRFLGVVLLCLFLVNGVIGIGSYVSFWHSYGIQIPRSYLVGASEAQVASFNRGNVLTFSAYPSRQLLFLAGVSEMKNIVPSEAFFAVKNASSFIALASSYNISTIFVTQQDINAIHSAYPGSFLLKALSILPVTYSDEETIVLQLPSFVVPSSSSQIHLVEGFSFSNESLADLWFMVLASAGFQYDVVDMLPSSGVAVLAGDVNGNLTEFLSYVFNGGKAVIFIQGQTGALQSWWNISYTDDTLAVDSLEMGNTTFATGLLNAHNLTCDFNSSDVVASYQLGKEKILPAVIRIDYGNGYVMFVNSEPFASSLIGSTNQPKEYTLRLGQISSFINKLLESLVSNRMPHKPLLEPFSNLFIGPVSLTGKLNFNLSTSADAIMFDHHATALLTTESKTPVLVSNASFIIVPRDSDLRVSLDSKEFEISNPVDKRVVDISMHGQSNFVITSTTMSPFDVYIINQYTCGKESIPSYRAVVWSDSAVKVNARTFEVTVDGCTKFEKLYYVDDLQRLRGLPWRAQSNFRPGYVMGSFGMQLIFLDSGVGAINLIGSFSVNVVQQHYQLVVYTIPLNSITNANNTGRWIAEVTEGNISKIVDANLKYSGFLEKGAIELSFNPLDPINLSDYTSLYLSIRYVGPPLKRFLLIAKSEGGDFYWSVPLGGAMDRTYQGRIDLQSPSTIEGSPKGGKVTRLIVLLGSPQPGQFEITLSDIVFEKGCRLNISELAITKYIFQNLIWLVIPVILIAAIASWKLVKTHNLRSKTP